MAAPLLRRAAPTLDREAGKQMWKLLDPLKKYTRQAEEKAGGAAEVGKTVLREIGLPGKSIGEAAMTPEELAPQIHESMKRTGAFAGDALTRAGADTKTAGFSANEILDPMYKVASRLNETAAGRQIAGSVRGYINNLRKGLGASLTDEEQAGIRAVAKGDADDAFPRVAKAAAVREERTGQEDPGVPARAPRGRHAHGAQG